jgi:hypothetical protein
LRGEGGTIAGFVRFASKHNRWRLTYSLIVVSPKGFGDMVKDWIGISSIQTHANPCVDGQPLTQILVDYDEL